MRKGISRKTSSIANKINVSFWVRLLFQLLFLDALILAAFLGCYVLWCDDHVRQTAVIAGRDLVFDSVHKIIYSVTAEDGRVFEFYGDHLGRYLLLGGGVIAVGEFFVLFFSLFSAGTIRAKLRPLNELAIRAEEFSSAPVDSNKMEELAKAIDHVETDATEVSIATGNSDLYCIEIALNNLLARIREQERQQARFVSDASHELRTPISVIQGYVGMLDRWGKEDENVLTEAIEALKNESEHMKELVEQLLFLARGDSGRNTLHFVEFNLNDVVTEVWEESMMIDEKHRYRLMLPNTEGKTVPVTGDPEEDGELAPVSVTGDVAMLKQTMRILVQNAAKYSNEGDAITIGTRFVDGEPAFTVQDEGMGMHEKDVSHIFERFYRSDVARAGNTGGSGLGLSIAKWIVDAHKGTIEVLSRPEFGTRFTVTLHSSLSKTS